MHSSINYVFYYKFALQIKGDIRNIYNCAFVGADRVGNVKHLVIFQKTVFFTTKNIEPSKPFKDVAQTAIFKDPVRTAL